MTTKPLTFKMIRRAVDRMRMTQIRPDMNGNLRFIQDDAGRWHPIDERDSWLSGKSVGVTTPKKTW